jgi:hypothetical protein
MSERNEEFDIGDLFADEQEPVEAAAPPEAEPAVEAVDGQQEQEEAPQSGQESDSAPETETEPSPPIAQEPTASDRSELDSLREELRRSQGLLAELQGQFIKSSGQKAQSEKEAPKGPSIPDYMFQIPDEIANGVYSDDASERKAALAHLVSGIGQSVHQTLLAEFEGRLASVQKELPERMTQTVEAQNLREQIRQDFYGSFRDLDRAELYPLVKHFTGQVMAEGKHKSWGPALRDEIGKRTKAYLESFGAPKAQSKPPAMTAPQSRPPQRVPGLEDEIAELIDL